VTKELSSLSTGEQAQLAACETVIARGLRVFTEVGSALMRVRDGRLYRARFKTFEDYCDQRWSISRPRAYQLMEAASVVSTVVDKAPDLPAPSNERQVRELAKVPEPERAKVWRETVERTEGKPTAAAVQAVREERAPAPAATTFLAPVPESPRADQAAPTDPEQLVAQAVDRHLGPDREAPKREIQIAFLDALGDCMRVTQYQADEIAGALDDDCMKQLALTVDSLLRFQDRVISARSKPRPDNVRHLKAVS
jgi:hypothetical protein